MRNFRCAYNLFIPLVCGVLMALVGCGGGSLGTSAVDSLNWESYRMRYVDIDSAECLAKQSLALAGEGTRGRALALGNVAFVEYMRMDYENAAKHFKESMEECDDDVARLMACVGMMKICHHTSKNKEYYDYSMKGREIASPKSSPEGKDFDSPTFREGTGVGSWEEALFNYALSEFYMAGAAFYSSQMQDREARECFRMVRDSRDWVEKDTAQLARYCQLYATIGQGSVDDNMKLQYLTEMYTLSKLRNLTYMKANALQQIGEYLIRFPEGAGKMSAFRSLLDIDGVSDDSLGIVLAERSLDLYKEYGSVYSRVQAYITIDNFNLKHDMPERALDSALVVARLAHLDDVDKAWKDGKPLDWIGRIHEHLSIVYGSLGDKEMSDVERNAYLDILDETRLDKFYEQRKEVLEKDENRLKWILTVVYAVGGVIIVGCVVFSLLVRRRKKAQIRRRQELIDEERAMLEMRLAKNKRGYINKCTSISIMNGIRPFLSRAIKALEDREPTPKEPTPSPKDSLRENSSGEINLSSFASRSTFSASALKGRETGGDLEEASYIEDLFEKISEYNDVLTHWIKMKQGEVKLQVETFALQPLFDTLTKNRNSFEDKGLTLIINDSDAVVKADKTLTLFMMNTLLDNARKFTDKGSVELKAEEREDYVEISVKDTGRGFNVESQTPELGVRSEELGVENPLSSTPRQLSNSPKEAEGKGFGFGLMNCKGIIEKYRKTSRIFSVCSFNVESEVGKGSRFSFRLPKGKLRMIVAFLMLAAGSCVYAQTDDNESGRLLDMKIPEDSLLTRAHEFADSAFYANVDRCYEKTLMFADSVIDYLNKYYHTRYPDGSKLMVLNGGHYMPELEWWDAGFETDYVTILDIRNEVAIASLALKQLVVYVYNNNVYARLYKLCGQDKSLENYCETLNETNQHTRLAIWIVGALIVIGIILYYFAQKYWFKLNDEINNDENRRMEYEDNNLHVQNMVLDNCLSTIKHETMYYPSKILNILKTRGSEGVGDARELATYYEEVFGMLSEHAMKQLENVQFKRRVIKASSLVDYFYELLSLENPQKMDDANVLGDEEMLKYMVENLTQLGKENNINAKDLHFYFAMSEGFVKFAFEEAGVEMTEEEMSQLFYPDNLRYDASEDVLHGTQFLICKQIIREHDEHCGRRGCRIYAEKYEADGEKGLRIVFTLPKK